MKAYIVGLKSNPDVGNEIIYAKNSREARKSAEFLDLTDLRESYIDVTVHRCPEFDDKEDYSAKEFMKEQWLLGWWFFEDGCPFVSNSTVEDFYKWFEDKYEKDVII